MEQTIDAIGIFGSIVLIIAFSKCTIESSFGQSSMFLILNIIGSCLLFPSAIFHESVAAQGICAFWIIASLIALFNSNKLPKNVLILMTTAFTTFVIYSLYNISDVFSYTWLAKSASLFSVEIFVLSYALYISKQVNDFSYFLSTIIGNAIFIPCLFLENNIASLTLQSFCFIMGIVGIARVKRISHSSIQTNS